MNLTTKQLEVFNLILSLETNREIRALNTKSTLLKRKVDHAEKQYKRLQARLDKMEA